MKLKNTLLCITVSLLLFKASAALAEEEGFKPLFDGKTFAGWEGETENIFRIAKGVVVAGSRKSSVPQNEFLCTIKQYGDFELRLEARLVGEGKNAGVQFRSQRIPNHHEVKGYQCDMGLMGERSIWGSLYDESRRRKFLAEGNAEKLAKTVKQGDWNALKIRCQGPRVQIWVNGLLTVDFLEKNSKIARRGVIGLQIHGGPPAEASYRNILIKEL